MNIYQRNHKDADDEWLEEKRNRATETLNRAYAVFGGECFRRARELDDGTWEWVATLNSAIYDVVMLNFARIDASPDELSKRKDELEQMTADLSLTDESFLDAVSLATGDRTRLFTRVRIYAEALSELGLTTGLEDISASDD